MRKINPEISKICNKSQQASDVQANDEEVSSSSSNEEDEDSGSDEDMDMNVKSGEYNDDTNLEEMDEPSQSSHIKKHEFEKHIRERYASFLPFRDATVQKWLEKVQTVGEKSARNNFSAFQLSGKNLIQHGLKDKEFLVKRTQLKRTKYNIIGCAVDAKNDQSGKEYNEEIFDDDDFYHQLLREVIERKTAHITNPIELTRTYMELQKTRTRIKKNVNTKASKGRRIRYQVHPKLVNFFAPQDNSSMSENAVKELSSSLFGK